jgi:hypothetical protein
MIATLDYHITCHIFFSKKSNYPPGAVVQNLPVSYLILQYP